MTDSISATDVGSSPTTAQEQPDRFQDYALPEPLMRAINDLGFEFCTPIQANPVPRQEMKIGKSSTTIRIC